MGSNRNLMAWAAMTGIAAALLIGGKAGAELLSSLFPDGVPGYDAAPGVTVKSRARPGYEPLGVPLPQFGGGGFMLWPRVEQSIGYDNNVLAGSHKRGSAVVRTEPSLLLSSRWARDALGAYVSVGDTRYPDLPAQGRTDVTLSVGGSVEIGDDRLTLAAAHVQRHQDRSALDALASDRPVSVRVDDARASYAINFGRWSLTPHIELASWRFGDASVLGVPVGQSYRDRLVVQGGATVRYEMAPLRNLIFSGRAIGQSYTAPLPGQAAPDSQGYQFLAGLDYDDDAVWRYRLLAGGAKRYAVAYRPRVDFVGEAEASWSPNGMTTLRANLSRSVEDAAQEGVVGFTYTGGKLAIDHEYMRNVLLTAMAGMQQAEFNNQPGGQSGGRQSGYLAGAGVSWLVNRAVRLSLTHDIVGVSGSKSLPNGLSGDHTRQQTLLRVRLGL